MDPYIQRLFTLVENEDPITVLETTPKILEGYLTSFFEPELERSYAPDKWSVQEILAHLADVELGLGYRFRQALAEESYQPESFDQNLWARRYKRLEPSLAVETFRALRAWNLALFATFDLEDWNRKIDYTFAGIETVDDMVRLLAGHDLNHLAQLEQVAQSV